MVQYAPGDWGYQLTSLQLSCSYMSTIFVRHELFSLMKRFIGILLCYNIPTCFAPFDVVFTCPCIGTCYNTLFEFEWNYKYW